MPGGSRSTRFLALGVERGVAALLALTVPCEAALPAVPEAAVQARELLDRWVAQGSSPGVQYVFASADDVLFEHHAGSADAASGAPVTPQTTFNAYSITKTFTAAAVLQLAEQGRLELDRPIASYLDRFPYPKSPTLLETLAHTGGFPNPNPMAWVHLAEEHAAFDTRQFVDTVLRENPHLNSQPGRSCAYSNVGYLLLGEAIEKVCGLAYPQYVQRHLIDPLQLRGSETLGFSIAQPQQHARGHVRRWGLVNLVLGWFIERERFVEGQGAGWVRLRHLQVHGAAYGGLIGNARGLARYAQALLKRDDYVSPHIRERLFTPARTADGNALERSVGWFKGELNGETYYTHAGGAAGYYCELRIYPRLRRVSVVMFNRTGIRDERVLDKIDRFFLAGSGPRGRP
jgi:D-alanyl-D-alanine carboxypeptidase